MKLKLITIFSILILWVNINATSTAPIGCKYEFELDDEVYLGGVKVVGVDVTSFKPFGNKKTVSRSTLIKDKNGVYLLKVLKPNKKPCINPELELLKQLIIKDPDSFTNISYKHGLYFKDKHYVYSFEGQHFSVLGNTNNYNFEKFKPLRNIVNVKIQNKSNKEIINTRYVLNDKILLKKYSKNNYKVDIQYSDSEYQDDGTKVFYQLKEILNADRDSFWPISVIAHDKNFVYKREKILFKKNGMFRVLGNSRFAKDESHLVDLYRNEIVENVDAKSFNVLNNYYAKDQTSVYSIYGGSVKKLKDANVNTFNVLSSSYNEFYATDDQFAYGGGFIINKADRNSFISLLLKNKPYDNYAIDKNNVFYNSRIIPNVDIKTFTISACSLSEGNGYRYDAKDKNYYYRNGNRLYKRIEDNVDPACYPLNK